jgi:hypothetical protein
MNKAHLLDQAEQVMRNYVCNDQDEDARQAMDRLVHQFFSDRVMDLDPSAIMDRMGTPMKALDWFNGYLCETFRERCCTDPFPEEADTCTLA